MTGHVFSIQHKFATEFLEALGVDHSKVKYIKMEMGVDRITEVTIEYFMEDGTLKSLNALTKKYFLKLEERE